jgi:hypothetical protein
MTHPPCTYLFVATLALTACATDDEPVECPTEGRYMQLATGASWSYDVSGGKQKTQTVGALEDVGGQKAGTMAFKLTTTKSTGMTISWQQDTGTSIVRHREQDLSGTNHTDEFYSPLQTRIDENPAHVAVDASWMETYDELVWSLTTPTDPMTTAHKIDTWLVVSDTAQVEVPAGRFCALQLKRTTQLGSNPLKTKYYWFARGVGKIKEKDDEGDVEALTSFTLP